jgi:CheY-like chemotaxis protein
MDTDTVMQLRPLSRPGVVLCIDDDESILQYQRAALERKGYTAVSVASPKEGVRLAVLAGFDAVIVDYMMSELNGHEVASEIRRARPDIPIIMFSGSNVPACVYHTINAFVSKDNVQQLMPVLGSFVEPVVCKTARGGPHL